MTQMAQMEEKEEKAGHPGRKILVNSGRLVDPFTLSAGDIDIKDIANSLSKQCRFTGHTRRFYSVAQHSVLVSEQVAPAHRRAALLHDAAEAYVSDIAAPWKGCVYICKKDSGVELMETFKEMEHSVLERIFRALGVPWGGDLPQEVKEADIRMVATEGRQLMPRWESAWSYDVEPYEEVWITPVEPRKAFNIFMAAWERYSKEAGAA